MKVIILRGLPGVGKTTWRDKNHPYAYVCSADYFHINQETGKYEFKPENAKAAHANCRKVFFWLLHRKPPISTIVVDNTNTTAWEIAYYYLLAEDFGAEVEIVHLNGPLELCFNRGIHHVPIETMQRMKDNLTVPLPTFWKQTVVNVFDNPLPGESHELGGEG